MLREAKNICRIEGILLENDLKYGSYQKMNSATKSMETVESISGIIKIRVDIETKGVPTTLEIPVHLFANKYTKEGNLSKAYASIEDVMNNYKSAAVVGINEADCVRISNGKVSINEYYGKDDKLVSFPRITAMFISKVSRDKMIPRADFELEMMVANKVMEVDKEAVETGRMEITGIVPCYGGRVEVIKTIVASPEAIEVIDRAWNKEDTVTFAGRINFTSTIVEKTQVPDFGEPTTVRYTKNLSELIITAGQEAPLDGEFAFDVEEINKGLAERNVRLEELKKKKNDKKAKSEAISASSLNNLGF